ncbi:hypothetical protein K432DRAFT_425579 [Lepidopterella palustris CBS 459.81]|uniref:Heterokaryon incompatibility domain-containing protein n=1 Tax=Lepidopterella palustris CBS 459.81 TaxID=1314670 RepID=A0A8E2EBE4_9PEZI|nr:hypothetical protein K432DRAFT_425579 [Lepidopterella palustris CBS 459.81]
MASLTYTPLQDFLTLDTGKNSRTIEESESLVNGDWEIRLLSLLPAKTRDTAITCELLHTTLRVVKGNYDALSYVWADTTTLPPFIRSASACINIAGSEVPVTPNLHAALSRLRYKDRNRLLWVDQICINQADVHERNIQVERMTLIYGLASRTVVWLGEEAENSYRGILLARGLARLRMEHKTETDAMFKAVVAEFSDVERWTALDRILQRAWWHRTWVVQECVVAASVDMVCGYRDISFSELARAMLLLEELRDSGIMPECVGRVNIASVVALLGSRARTAPRGWPGGQPSWEPALGFDSLFKVLSRYRTRDATDPRDKVYALLRLAQDFRDAVRASTSHTNPIPVDYNRAVEDVYSDCVNFLLASTKRLDFLAACRTKRNLVHLPSWVPDWSDTAEAPLSLGEQNKYAATSDSVPCNASIQPHGRRLNALGIPFDHIKLLATPCVEEDFAYPYPSATLRQWKALAFSQGQDEESFARTIIADLYRNRRLSMYAVTSCLDMYRIWHQRSADIWATEVKMDMVLETIDFTHALRRASLGRRFCISERGVAGLVPADAIEGDLLVGLVGANVPYVIRAASTGSGSYVLIGECYLHGFMDGQLTQENARKEFSFM